MSNSHIDKPENTPLPSQFSSYASDEKHPEITIKNDPYRWLKRAVDFLVLAIFAFILIVLEPRFETIGLPPDPLRDLAVQRISEEPAGFRAEFLSRVQMLGSYLVESSEELGYLKSPPYPKIFESVTYALSIQFGIFMKPELILLVMIPLTYLVLSIRRRYTTLVLGTFTVFVIVSLPSFITISYPLHQQLSAMLAEIPQFFVENPTLRPEFLSPLRFLMLLVMMTAGIVYTLRWRRDRLGLILGYLAGFLLYCFTIGGLGYLIVSDAPVTSFQFGQMITLAIIVIMLGVYLCLVPWTFQTMIVIADNLSSQTIGQQRATTALNILLLLVIVGFTYENHLIRSHEQAYRNFAKPEVVPSSSRDGTDLIIAAVNEVEMDSLQRGALTLTRDKSIAREELLQFRADHGDLESSIHEIFRDAIEQSDHLCFIENEYDLMGFRALVFRSYIILTTHAFYVDMMEYSGSLNTSTPAESEIREHVREQLMPLETALRLSYLLYTNKSPHSVIMTIGAAGRYRIVEVVADVVMDGNQHPIIIEEVNDFLLTNRLYVTPIENRILRALAPGLAGSYPSIQHISGVPSALRTHSIEQANFERFELLLLRLAILRYRADTGTPPPTLDALVPEYLSAIPLSVITNKPFHYQVLEDGSFILQPEAGLDRRDF